MPINVSLNWNELMKIDPKKLYQGKSGPMLDLKLVETKGNKYGNDYFVTQSAKKNPDGTWPKTPILGNGKVLGQRSQQQDDGDKSRYEQRAQAERPTQSSDEPPF